MAQGTTVADVIICTAIEVLQSHECLESRVFCGASSGMNTEISTHFNNTLHVNASTVTQIHTFFRELAGLTAPFLGYLSRTPLNARADTARNSFVSRYMNTTGITTGGYIPNFGKYLTGPVYLPLSKYLAVQSGTGSRPHTAPFSRFAFETLPPQPEAGEAHFFLDGERLILIHGGGECNATHAPDLEGGMFCYSNVTRAGGANYLGIEARMLNSGVFSFTTPIRICRKATATVLIFTGVFVSADSNYWQGVLPANTFDFAPFTYGLARATSHFNNLGYFHRLTPIWTNCLHDMCRLTAGAEAAIAARPAMGIFSPTTMFQFAQDASYVNPHVRLGKRGASDMLSVIYALYVIMGVTDRYLA